MIERSKEIFGNPISEEDYKKACRSKQRYIRKFGDDSDINYPIRLKKNPILGERFGLIDVLLPEELSDTNAANDQFDDQAIIIGNIRMGFGHYRIAMAMASAAHALGYTPYWMDLNSYPQTTCTKVISAQNDLYSLGSRLSKNKAFNKAVWEPMNYEGFRALSYNASDQKNAELMAPVYRNVPKDIPVIGTHAWPSQAAVHAGMKYVVNAIPDNWPMALHLAEGSLHTVQTRNAYNGYKVLNGMDKNNPQLKPMGDDALIYTGHYVDHELVENIEKDCAARIARKKKGEAMRFLLTIGGAGAQKEIFSEIIHFLIPYMKEDRAVVYVNVGDYKKVWDELKEDLPPELVTQHMNDYGDTMRFSDYALDHAVKGIHAFYHHNIFEAVYATNLLMHSTDVLITKPSELSFYPVPKLFIQRVGKHEMWGAIHSSEIGDGTMETDHIELTKEMLKLFIENDDYLIDMCQNIITNKKIGLYNGAYEAVKAAFRLKGQ